MNLKYPEKIKPENLINFFKKLKMNKLLIKSEIIDLKVNQKMQKQKNLYKPQLMDLYRLYKFITLNKRYCVLEFGCGYSSSIINLALAHNKENFYLETKNLRSHNLFQHHVVDDDKKYLNILRKDIPKNKISFLHYSKNKIKLTGYQISNEYEKLPNINPDFIYIDGPDIFKIKGKKNIVNFSQKDMMPMNSDILKIENFLTPGTIILMDGRTANARFLFNNFKRKWKYKYDEKFDQNIFLLDEKPLGRHNRSQLKYYKFI